VFSLELGEVARDQSPGVFTAWLGNVGLAKMMAESLRAGGHRVEHREGAVWLRVSPIPEEGVAEA
jgi:hypothetical protein